MGQNERRRDNARTAGKITRRRSKIHMSKKTGKTMYEPTFSQTI